MKFTYQKFKKNISKLFFLPVNSF